MSKRSNPGQATGGELAAPLPADAPASSPDERFVQDALDLIRSGHQVILVPTREERRVLQLLAMVGDKMAKSGDDRDAREVAEEAENAGAAKDEVSRPYRLITWDSANGLMRYRTGTPLFEGAQMQTLATQSLQLKNTLSWIMSADPNKFPVRSAIMVLIDAHNDLNGPLQGATRRLLAMGAKNYMFMRVRSDKNPEPVRRPVFLVQPDTRIHPDIADSMAVLRFELPGHPEHVLVTQRLIRNLPPEKNHLNEDGVHEIAHALSGLSRSAASDALGLAMIKGGRADLGMLKTIHKLKADMIALGNPALRYIPVDTLEKVPDVVGYDDLVEYVRVRSAAYSRDAESLRLEYPKGISVVGLGGTGKTMLSVMVAKRLRKPLLRYKVSALYDSAVGASERRARETHETIDRVDDCVVHVDEADKLFSSVTEGKNDGGVGQRVFAEFLEWLSAKNSRAFVIMTLNRFDGIPDELFRKGRFDEVFYVDLPDPVTRVEILKTHLRDKGIDPAIYRESAYEEFSQACHEFTGAEILQVLIDARAEEFEKSGRKSATPNMERMIYLAKLAAPRRQAVTSQERLNGMDKIKARSRPVWTPKGVRAHAAA